MRALFLEALVDSLSQQGLGISFGCLDHVRRHVDRIIDEHGASIRERDNFIQAYAEFHEFVLRMVRTATEKGYGELHEDTFDDAREQCGLIWRCRS